MIHGEITRPEKKRVIRSQDERNVTASRHESTGRNRGGCAIGASNPFGVAGEALCMWSQTRSRLARLDGDESECRQFLRFKTNDELEAVGEKRLHHEAHLVLSDVGRWGFRLDNEGG